MCAQFAAMDFRKFFSFKLTFVGFFQASTQRSLEKCDVFYRFLYDFNLKKAGFTEGQVLDFFLSPRSQLSAAGFKVSYLRNTRPTGRRWNQRTESRVFQRLHLLLVVSHAFSHFATSEVLELFLVAALAAEHCTEICRSVQQSQKISRRK